MLPRVPGGQERWISDHVSPSSQFQEVLDLVARFEGLLDTQTILKLAEVNRQVEVEATRARLLSHCEPPTGHSVWTLLTVGWAAVLLVPHTTQAGDRPLPAGWGHWTNSDRAGACQDGPLLCPVQIVGTICFLACTGVQLLEDA